MGKAYSYIRFSTPGQLEGDSLRRQLEASQNYAQKHNLELDTSLRDYGKSGYDGTNRRKGALRDFFDLIKRGEISKGSYLLVENLDRLSREKPMDAYDQFRDIIKEGITVVTLNNGTEYTEESINDPNRPGQLYMIVGEIQRAHGESQRKSEMIGKAWERGRNDTLSGKRKLTAMSVAWVKLNKDKTEFEIVPKAEKTINEIFKLKKEGMGNNRIIQKLNSDPVKYWTRPISNRNKSGLWRESYVQKIINNRAVTGEFELHKFEMSNGKKKRVPTGEIISDYYPKIISIKKFNNLQNQIKINFDGKGNGGGRTGKMNNVFRHLLVCGLCKSPITLVDKGKLQKSGKYLKCTKKNQTGGTQCNAKQIRQDEFQKIFFKHIEDIDFSTLLPEQERNNHQIKIKKIEEKIISNNIDIPRIEEELEKVEKGYDNAEDERVRQRLNKRMIDKLDAIEKLKKKNRQLDAEKRGLVGDVENLQRIKDNSKKIYQMLQSLDSNEEGISIRIRLNTELKKYINTITIYPLQSIDDEIAWVKSRIQKYHNKKEKPKMRVFLSYLQSALRELEEEKLDPSNFEFTYESKSIDRIAIKYKSMIEFPSHIIALKNQIVRE